MFLVFFSTMFMQLFNNYNLDQDDSQCVDVPKLYTFFNDASIVSRVGQYNTFFNSLVSTFKLIFGAFDFGFFDETINK